MNFLRAARRWVLPAVLLALLVVQVRRTADLVRAQRLVRAVEGRTLMLVRSGTLQRAPILAHLQALADAKRLDPAEVAIRVAIGTEHFLLGNYVEARRAYTDALALEPRPETYLNLAKAQLADHEEAGAILNFARAVRLDPSLNGDVPAAVRQPVLDALRRQDGADRPQQD